MTSRNLTMPLPCPAALKRCRIGTREVTTRRAKSYVWRWGGSSAVSWNDHCRCRRVCCLQDAIFSRGRPSLGKGLHWYTAPFTHLFRWSWVGMNQKKGASIPSWPGNVIIKYSFWAHDHVSHRCYRWLLYSIECSRIVEMQNEEIPTGVVFHWSVVLQHCSASRKHLVTHNCSSIARRCHLLPRCRRSPRTPSTRQQSGTCNEWYICWNSYILSLWCLSLSPNYTICCS